MLTELYGTTYTIFDLFDFDYYKTKFNNPPFSTPEEGLDHYNNHGWRDGLNPSNRFDTQFYLARNPDVHAAGTPLGHYIKHGQWEGRRRLPKSVPTEVLSPAGLEVYNRVLPFADRAYYFDQSRHGLDCDVDALMHYFAYGHSAGWRPTPHFDANFYREHNKDVAENGIDPLLHYVQFGWREMRHSLPGQRLLALPAADAEKIDLIREHLNAAYYVSKLPGIDHTDVDLAAHYYFHGEKAGLDPNQEFSSSHYLRLHPDVRKSSGNAFYHFLSSGRAEGRPSTPTGYPVLKADVITLADFDDLDLSPGYLPFADPTVPFVYVILPVYRGYDESLGALKAALTASNVTPYKILVLDDHSPDAALSADLAAACTQVGAGYGYNEENLGFVANVNRGLGMVEAAGPAHVILLNADTVVYDHWIDRMAAHLATDPAIATITPMSNNATINSYPRFCADNRFNLELSHAELADLALKVDLAPVDVVTGVGFAMFISRPALEQVGRLDVAAFGKGYGEEVDFCQRAALEGMRNVAAPDVFVTHYGSVSFKETQKAQYDEGQSVLNARYPTYETAVFDFIHADPMQPVRQAYDIERLVRLCQSQPFVISISHSRGGGIQTYIDQMTQIARDSGIAVLDIAIVGGSSFSITATFPANLSWLDNLNAVPLDTLMDLLERLATDCRWYLFNSMIGAGRPARTALTQFLERHSQKLVYLLHDFAVYCPRANYTHVTQTYCDGPQPLEKCQACVRTFTTTPDLDVAEWRSEHKTLLTTAAHVISPSQSAPDYLWDKLSLPLTVRPHYEPDLQGLRPLNRQFPAQTGDKLVFAVLGAIGPHKGSRVLRALKAYINRYDVEMEIHLIGYCDLNDLADNARIFVHGAYQDNAEAMEWLHKIRPHAVLGLSVWPETYCYTLSIPLALGIPVIAFDIGAQGERVRNYPRGALLDFGLRNNIQDLATELMTIDIEGLWRTPVQPHVQPAYSDLDAYVGKDGVSIGTKIQAEAAKLVSRVKSSLAEARERFSH